MIFYNRKIIIIGYVKVIISNKNNDYKIFLYIIRMTYGNK